MLSYVFLDEKAQISAEMILLLGALLVIVLVAGAFILDIAQSVAGNVSEVVDNARDTTINKM